MGYSLHIERQQETGEFEPISVQEWEALIASDPGLESGAEDPMVCLWKQHPLGGIAGNIPYFAYASGRISTRKADEFVSLKMFEIAEKLQASLMDDEDVLDEQDRKVLEEDCNRILQKRQASRKKAWWRFFK